MVSPRPWQAGQVRSMVKKPWRRPHLADAAAGAARGGRGAGLGAAARAVFAHDGCRHADLRRLALIGFRQRDFHVVAKIGAPLARRALARAALAHELAEQIVEHRRHRGREIGAEAGAAGPAAECRIEGGMAEAVIGRAALRVFQRLVGLVELLEAALGVRIAVAAVGMAFLGEMAKRGLDLAVTRAAIYAEHLVVAPLCHRPSGPLHRRRVAALKPLVLGRRRVLHPAPRPCTLY